MTELTQFNKLAISVKNKVRLSGLSRRTRIQHAKRLRLLIAVRSGGQKKGHKVQWTINTRNYSL